MVLVTQILEKMSLFESHDFVQTDTRAQCGRSNGPTISTYDSVSVSRGWESKCL